MIEVTDDRDRNHAWCGSADPLHETHGDQHLEGRCHQTHGRRRSINAYPQHDHRLATEAIRQRAVEQLAKAETDQKDDDHQLLLIAISQAIGIPDQRQRGQHDVDGHGGQGHETGHQADKFHHPHDRCRRWGRRRYRRRGRRR